MSEEQSQSSFFRSDSISHYNLILPRESAWDIMNKLGTPIHNHRPGQHHPYRQVASSHSLQAILPAGQEMRRSSTQTSRHREGALRKEHLRLEIILKQIKLVHSIVIQGGRFPRTLPSLVERVHLGYEEPYFHARLVRGENQ